MTNDKSTPRPWKSIVRDLRENHDFYLHRPSVDQNRYVPDLTEVSEHECLGLAALLAESATALHSAVNSLDAYRACVEALKPFAEFINSRAFEVLPDDHVLSQGSLMARRQLTIGDCRKARAALSQLQAQGQEK